MACGSSLQAILCAHQNIVTENREVVLVGGAESMSRVPYLLEEARFGYRMGHQRLTDAMYRDGFVCPLCGLIMGETAENLVDRHGISREEQDAFAAESQNRAERARNAGLFKDEIVAVQAPGRRGDTLVTQDEHPRDGVTPASLSKLPPVFRKPSAACSRRPG
jgi:acetyl-CoA C-acetyltransferase